MTSLTVLILLIPLISMQFTEEVNWGVLDFAVASVLLFCIIALIDLLIGKALKSPIQIGMAFLLILLFLLLWAEFAVGLFGTPFGGS